MSVDGTWYRYIPRSVQKQLRHRNAALHVEPESQQYNGLLYKVKQKQWWHFWPKHLFVFSGSGR